MLGRLWQLVESLKGLRCWTFAFSGETLWKLWHVNSCALCFHEICFLRLQLVDPKRLLMPSRTKPGAAFPLQFMSGTEGIHFLHDFVLRLRLRLCRAYQFQVWFELRTSSFTHTWNTGTSMYPGPNTDEETSNAQSFTEMTRERPKDLKSKCSCIERATV